MCSYSVLFGCFFIQAGPNYDLKKWEEDQSRIADVTFGAKDAKVHSQVCTLLQEQTDNCICYCILCLLCGVFRIYVCRARTMSLFWMMKYILY